MLCSVAANLEDLRAAELNLHAERKNADAISWSLCGVTNFPVEKPGLQQDSRPELPSIAGYLGKPLLLFSFHMNLCILPGPQSLTKTRL